MGGEGALEYLEFRFGCRDVKVIVDRVVGDIPVRVEEGTKDFGLETIRIGCWLTPITQSHTSTSARRWLYRCIYFVFKGKN